MRDAVDPAVVRFDVRLHRVDAERAEAVGRVTQERLDGLFLCEVGDVAGAVADEQSLGDGLVAVEATRVVVAAADPGAGFYRSAKTRPMGRAI